MKVQITHLKAPWPAGAVVGSVVGLAAAVLPAWAAGKCMPLAGDDERPTEFEWEPPQAIEAEFVVNPAAEADRKAVETAALLEDQAQQLKELHAHLQDAAQALNTARAEIASLVVERDAAVQRAIDVAVALDSAASERDAALVELQALRDGLPAVTGDGTGEALPPIEDAKAPATAKAAKKGAAA